MLTRREPSSRLTLSWHDLLRVAPVCMLLGFGPAPAAVEAQAPGPMTLDRVESLVGGVRDGQLSETRAIAILRESCLSFEVTAFVISDMRAAGASDALIQALNDACMDRPSVTSLVIDPVRAIMEPGSHLDFSISVVGSGGEALGDRPVVWSSTDNGIASVTGSGTVSARGPGLVEISAESEGRAARAQVRVLPPTYSPGGVLATGLLLPGAGQFRVSRPLRGTLTILATAGAVAWGYATQETTQFCLSPVGPDATCPPEDVLGEEVGRPNLVPGIAVGFAVMVLSAIDASLHAKSQNSAAERLRANPFGPEAGLEFDVEPDGTFTTSWRIRVR